MTKNILVIHPNADTIADALRTDGADATIVPLVEEMLGARTLPPGAHDHLEEAHAIVSIARWISPEIVAACKKLEWFQCLITGTDHLDDLLRGRGVVLTNARGIHGTQMSELAVLNMLVHMRQVPRLVRSQAAHSWDRVTPRVLRGRTVVILGVGVIAEAVARLCKAFGMRTIGVSRTPREVDGFDRVEPRERMLQAAGEGDFVVALLPLTPENRGVINQDFFAAMRTDACLINIARGGVVDEVALIGALRLGQIAAAGLDVFDPSPLPPESPLWDMENVFITPHLGGHSDQYVDDVLPIVATNLKKYLAGGTGGLINQVAL